MTSPEAVPQDVRFPDVAVELKHSLFVDAHGRLSAEGNLARSFAAVDAAYGDNDEAKLDYFTSLEASVHDWKIGDSSISVAHLDRGDETYGNHLVITLSPLNDGRPQSSAEAIHAYATSAGGTPKKLAAPNSWGPLVKASVGYELGRAEGVGAPHLQIFAPEKDALTTDDRKQLKAGNAQPYGRLVRSAIAEANRAKIARDGGTEGYTTIHLVAAGMCGKAIGAAMFMLKQPHDEYELKSVSLQNLSIGKDALQAAGSYMTRRTVEKPSIVTIPDGFAEIASSLIRQQTDGYGAELAMRRRNIAALYDLAAHVGKTGFTYENMPADLAFILNSGLSLSVANSADEGLNEGTEQFLQDIGGVDWVNMYGRLDEKKNKPTKVGQMANEHDTVMALTSTRGISRSLSNGRYPAA